MTRPFRLEEDERRYFALRSEFFIRLVQSGVPAQTIHETMRNFGKLEDMMFFEGVRQGMVTALFNADSPNRDPIELHGEMYHGLHTPLSRAEAGLVQSEQSFMGHEWLHREPLQLGPLTLNEAIEQYGPDLVVKRAPERPRAPATISEQVSDEIEKEVLVPLTKKALDPNAEAERLLERLANGEDPESVFGPLPPERPLEDLIEAKPDEPIDPAHDEPLHRPELLDRIRDVLVSVKQKPATWQDMILMLMRELRMDASYLDDILSTPMGMTVISQAELFHLHPGAKPEIRPVARP